MKKPVDTVKHVFVLYNLAPVGLLDASLDANDEAGLIFEHAATVSFTSCSASLPLAEATCWSRVSTSGEKCTSIPLKIRENRKWSNTRNGSTSSDLAGWRRAAGPQAAS